MTQSLFSPLRIGPYELAHRVVMAPLTRMRAARPGNVPRPLNAEYYAQRATKGGLIIAEASQIMPEGQGSPATPGIHSQEQVEGWKAVTEAVHAKGGVIFLQLWHVGRLSHPSHQPNGGLPVSASAVKPAGQALTADFTRQDFVAPRALETNEIPAIVEAYAEAARNAKAAGFDGIEIHSANGYLLEQFLQTRTNQRTDRYGGSIENRCRLPLEVTRAVVDVLGADKVGIRLSPFGVANDSGEADPGPLYTHLIKELAKLDLAFLHLVEPRASGTGQAEVDHQNVPMASELYRPFWPGVLIAAGNYKADAAEATVASGQADAIAFGRLFISNPDLPERLRRGAPLTPYNRATFYGGDEAGYTDYPTLDEAAA
ncbi:alkene reductase [Enterovirga rhinocerotis]|uniref:N-ethylmaleimide reductase n=1 Tax=Enterovirga rhinocerotis TaxID=1339210 RepID=A0A4R7BVK2_9HYPH|nr:alkene reductase [Enterovirga rhinocerotis]TDR89102.1 N-ethylmaleimide reductase [Enterovirga rhinocerotis]